MYATHVETLISKDRDQVYRGNRNLHMNQSFPPVSNRYREIVCSTWVTASLRAYKILVLIRVAYIHC